MEAHNKLKVLLLCAGVGLLGGIGLYTFHYAHGLSYLSSDPKACVNCHIMQEQYDGWQKSSHHTVAVCVDCHMPSGFFAKYLTKAENGYLHSKAFTLQNFADPIQIRERSRRVTNEACFKCHEDITAELNAHNSVKGEAANCTHCHGSVGH